MSTEAGQHSIFIVYDEISAIEGEKGLGGITSKIVKKVGVLDTEKLADNLSAFCKYIGRAFEGVSTTIKDYDLESVELAVEVTAKGEIWFMGSVSADAKGGLKLVFKRQTGK
jgi:hypothetical protein